MKNLNDTTKTGGILYLQIQPVVTSVSTSLIMCCQNYLQAFVPLKTIKQAVIRNIIDHIISGEKYTLCTCTQSTSK
jgi:hypothetical protein